MNRLHLRVACACTLLVAGAASNATEGTTYPQFLQWLEEHRAADGMGLPAGETIHADRLALLTPYLPPGYYAQFEFPEIAVEIQPTAHYAPHPVYLEATAAQQSGTAIGPDGRLEHHVAGLPFSAERIRGAPASEAGFMVAWNNIFRWQYYGRHNANMTMNYIRPGGTGQGGALPAGFEGGGVLDRFVRFSYQRVYLSHLAMLPAQDHRLDIDDAERILYKDYLEFVEPFDMAGTKFVIERSLDPLEEDQVYSYLPTQRRVRRLSAKERADSFVGSDFSMDDFDGFSGRVLDYDWSYHGEKHVLHVSDGRHFEPRFFGPTSHISNDRWQTRPCFVVETKSHWKDHPYARRVLFIDQETYSTTLALVFDRDDVLYKTFTTAYMWPDQAAGGDAAALNASSPLYLASIAVDLRANRVTVTRANDANTFPDMTAALARRMFSVSNLTEGR